MTLGVILGIPDGAKIRAAAGRAYERLSLADAAFASLRGAMERGVAAQVFAPQLHGGEHFWPASVRAVAERDPAVAAWLQAEDLPNAQDLPSPLQSRWTDAATLPSRPLRRDALRDAAREEVAEFRRTFGRSPAVVVPPTFLWTGEVERAWASSGVRWVVTPGRRNVARDAQGGLVPEGPALRNAEQAESGVRYLVRHRYFEPALGHKAEKVIGDLARDRRLGRPTLLETHRANFVGDPARVEAARAELARALTRALEVHPDLRFLSTEELGESLLSGAPDLVDPRFCRRARVWLDRAAEVPRLPKLTLATGLVAVWAVLHGLTGLCQARRLFHGPCGGDGQVTKAISQ
jgi:hypothetical protein